MPRLLIHAPGVHVGGGMVLLREILAIADPTNTRVNLDQRTSDLLDINPNLEYDYIKHSIFSRLYAEFRLFQVAKDADTVLCFHGMPPIFPVRGKVIVFLQNRNYLGLESLSSFSGRTRIRLALERFICRAFRQNVTEYIVQSLSMRLALEHWGSDRIPVKISPFMPMERVYKRNSELIKKYDFIYVSDGEHHKNHRNLFMAWKILADEKIFPSLILTIPERHQNTLKELDKFKQLYSLNIENMGELKHDKVMIEYQKSRALIFPSKAESFGLPLVEAARFGLDIIAGELDYVRDVCDPTQTFDPESPLSIARAVKRFLGMPMQRVRIHSAEEFLKEL